VAVDSLVVAVVAVVALWSVAKNYWKDGSLIVHTCSTGIHPTSEFWMGVLEDVAAVTG